MNQPIRKSGDYLNAVTDVYARLLAMIQPTISIEAVCGQCIQSLASSSPEKPFLPIVAATILFYLPEFSTVNVDYDKNTVDCVRETYKKLFRPLCEVGAEFLRSDNEIEAKGENVHERSDEAKVYRVINASEAHQHTNATLRSLLCPPHSFCRHSKNRRGIAASVQNRCAVLR